MSHALYWTVLEWHNGRGIAKHLGMTVSLTKPPVLDGYDTTGLRYIPEIGEAQVQPEPGQPWRRMTEAEIRDLGFAWLVAKHVTSNAIVLAKDGAVVGVGAGQMSRVDAADIAVRKAGERAAGAVVVRTVGAGSCQSDACAAKRCSESVIGRE